VIALFVKSRKVNDVVWIIFGIAGTSLYFFDTPVSFVTFVWMIFGCIVAGGCWKLHVYGGADGLSIITLSIVLPAYNHIPISICVLLASFVLSSSYIITSNIFRNTRSLILNEKLFSEISEPVYKKMLAFFIVHRRSRNEKYRFAAESIVDGKRKFVFTHDPDSERFGNTKYVTSSVPMMPILLGGLVFF
jgi:hypothetical protein